MLNNDEQLTTFIKKQSEIITKKLKLNPIKIEIQQWYDNCSCYYDENRILFGLEYMKELKNNKIETEVVHQDKFFNRIYFVIAHEIAHLLQYTKFPKWHLTYSKKWRSDGISEKDYSKQKLEKNASKIAGILLKRYKEEIKC